MLRRLDVEAVFRVYQIYGGQLERVARTMPNTTDVLVDTDMLVMEALYRTTYYLVVPIQFPDVRVEFCMLVDDVCSDIRAAALLWEALRNSNRWKRCDRAVIEGLSEAETSIVSRVLACTRPYLRLIA